MKTNKDLPEKATSFRWLIFLIFASAYFFVYFHRLSLSVIADDLVKDFRTTAGTIGVMGSLYFFCYAIMQFPAGMLSDSLGPRKTTTISLLIASVGCFIFGFSPNVEVAIAGRVLVGLGVSMVFVSTLKVLSLWFRIGEFALIVGLLNAVGGIALLSATWLFALMTDLLGWRMSFKLIGIATLALVGLVWFVIRDAPSDKGPLFSEEKNSECGGPTAQKKIGLWDGARFVISEKYFWPLAVWFFFTCGIFFGFGALWAGPYLIHIYRMTKEEAGLILSTMAWGLLAGGPLMGFLSERVFKSRKKLILLSSTILAIELIFLNIFPSSFSRAILPVLFLILSISASSIVVIGFTTTKELFPLEITGTSIGIINLFPFLGGAVFMPLLGYVLDSYPKSLEGTYSIEAYSSVLHILLGASLVSLVCTFLMKDTFPNKEMGVTS
jgi:sugar phosphate permease